QADPCSIPYPGKDISSKLICPEQMGHGHCLVLDLCILFGIRPGPEHRNKDSEQHPDAQDHTSCKRLPVSSDQPCHILFNIHVSCLLSALLFLLLSLLCLSYSPLYD